MSRWIDVEYCEDFFDRWESEVKDAEPVTIDVVQNVRTLLRDAPSIDLVRCEECKWGKPYSDKQLECDALGLGGLKFPDDFCSYGERKESE